MLNGEIDFILKCVAPDFDLQSFPDRVFDGAARQVASTCATSLGQPGRVRIIRACPRRDGRQAQPSGRARDAPPATEIRGTTSRRSIARKAGDVEAALAHS